jgi:hypothetical protein
VRPDLGRLAYDGKVDVADGIAGLLEVVFQYPPEGGIVIDDQNFRGHVDLDLLSFSTDCQFNLLIVQNWLQ